MGLNKKVSRPVHCKDCSKVLFVLEEERELNLTTKCPNCGNYQIVLAKQSFEIIVKSVMDGEIGKMKVIIGESDTATK